VPGCEAWPLAGESYTVTCTDTDTNADADAGDITRKAIKGLCGWGATDMGLG
jgi:hypothetical protein